MLVQRKINISFTGAALPHNAVDPRVTLFLFYKGWLIRDGKMGLVGILENLRDGD